MEYLAPLRIGLIQAALQLTPDSDVSVFAVRAQAACSSLIAELARLIGDGGAAVLCQRAQLLTAPRHPWLAALPAGSSDPPLYGMQPALATLTAEEARAGTLALLIELTDHLAILIGETLTARLLKRAWPDASQLVEKRI